MTVPSKPADHPQKTPISKRKKPCGCPICPSRYADASGLHRHRTVDHNIGRFHCLFDSCEGVYVLPRKPTIMTHLNRQHPGWKTMPYVPREPWVYVELKTGVPVVPKRKPGASGQESLATRYPAHPTIPEQSYPAENVEDRSDLTFSAALVAMHAQAEDLGDTDLEEGSEGEKGDEAALLDLNADAVPSRLQTGTWHDDGFAPDSTPEPQLGGPAQMPPIEDQDFDYPAIVDALLGTGPSNNPPTPHFAGTSSASSNEPSLWESFINWELAFPHAVEEMVDTRRGGKSSPQGYDFALYMS